LFFFIFCVYMISAHAKQFYEILVEIVIKEQKTFLLYSEIPYYIGADKCIEELTRENFVVKYSTAIGVRIHPVLPVTTERTREFVQAVVKEYGLI